MKTLPYLLATLTFASTLPAAFAQSVDNSGAWTQGQIEKLCYHRAKGNPRSFDDCLEHNSHKLGQNKQVDELSELNAADKILSQKAAERLQQETNGMSNDE